MLQARKSDYQANLELSDEERIKLKILAAKKQTTVKRLLADAVREHVLKPAENQE